MADLIDRQAAVELIKNYCENGCDLAEDNWCPSCQREQFVKLLKELPSAQPEIIRCKDCLHWVRTCGDNQWGLGDCDVFDKHLVMCEGYCAWAERRTDGN